MSKFTICLSLPNLQKYYKSNPDDPDNFVYFISVCIVFNFKPIVTLEIRGAFGKFLAWHHNSIMRGKNAMK